MKMQQGILFLFAILTCCSTAIAQQSPFTSFRGSDGTSSSDAKTPKQWTEDNFVWKTDLPGRGWSSPVYANGKIWLTAAEEVAAAKEDIEKKLQGVQYAKIKTGVKSIEMFALCVDLETGSVLKKIKLGDNDDPQLINPMNSFASPTCAIADGKVVCHFGAHGTWCLDTNSGEKLWHREFIINHSVGAGSSPVIDGDKVILVCDGCDQQYVAAVDLASGEDAWKTDRPPIEKDNDGEFRKSYCTPLVMEIDGVRQAIVPGSQWICSYNVETGEEVWRADYGFGFSLTPMAVWSDGLISFSTCYPNTEFVAVKPGKGDVTDQIAWRGRNAPAMSSFVTHEGKIYAVGDRPGRIMCLDAKTGELIKQVRLVPNVSASILKSGGHLYIGSRDGIMKVVECSPELNEVGSFDFKSPIYATSTVVGDDLLVRTKDSIIRIGAK
jgi:outer membrane protein assembly factor BamB